MPLDIARVRAALPNRDIRWHAEIASTMPEAASLAEQGCPAGTVVGADAQTAGQGRLGRAWHSAPDAGLYFTVVLRLGCALEELPIVTLALGLAAAESIAAVSGLACDLRWPNDVLVNERKVAGILTQLHAGAVVAGIGVNCDHEEFPPELVAIATSLRRESGKRVAREDLLITLLKNLDQYVRILQEQGKEPILRAFSHASSYVSGRRVVVENGAQRLSGVTDGLSPAGYLWLREENGRRTAVLAGGVRPA